MGVVSGVVLSYEFGTNWSRFSAVAGNVIGPLLGYEVLTRLLPGGDVSSASCCSAGGACRAGCTCSRPSMVAIGTAISAFWILLGQQLDAHARGP